MGQSNAARGKPRNQEHDIAYFPKTPPDAKGKRFTVAVELATAHLRMAIRATDARISLAENDPFRRAGFHMVGMHAWNFEPEPQGARFGIAEETADKVAAVLRQFLDHAGIGDADIERIGVGTVITFDPRLRFAVFVDTSAVEVALGRDFRDVPVVAGNRTAAALRIEHEYGAGAELRPSDQMIYVTISRNLNFDAHPREPSEMPFAGGIRHAAITLTTLENFGGDFIGAGYEPPLLDKCALCGRDTCLHAIASGQGMLAQIKGDEAAEEAARTAAQIRMAGYAEERGAADDDIDTSSIFKAASQNATCRRLVLQAGIAIGIALYEKILEVGTFEPDLIVLGGTVPMGRLQEDRLPLSHRLTVDGVMQQTLRRLLDERLPLLHVTRSRFAGFTSLLGLTLTPPGTA